MASVGVGSGVLKDELQDIAHDAEHILMYDNYNRLNNLAHEIIALIGRDCEDKKTNDEWPMRRHIAPLQTNGRKLEDVRLLGLRNTEK